MQPRGPGAPFTLLFDEESGLPPTLPEPFRQVYGGDWRPLEVPGRPYTFVNFVTARDGRVSYNQPGYLAGAHVSGFNAPDQWLMGLLRARADAVMVGDGTMRAEPEHIWTSDHIYPDDAAAFAALRAHHGLSPLPLHVLLSLDGEVEPTGAVFQLPQVHIVVATTERGKPRAQELLRGAASQVEILSFGAESADLPAVVRTLHERYGVRNLLCEGGPRVYGAMLQAGLVDEEFVTLSPLMLGAAPGTPRPSLVEGVAFQPGRSPRSTLISLRRAGDLLFLRSRWSYPA